MGALDLILAAAVAAAGQYDRTALPDHELERARGGFTLPNGIDVAITVQSQTVVDGAVVLRTVFQANHGPPTLTVFAPKPGETVAAPNGSGATSAASTTTAPTVTFDGRGGIQVMPGTTTPSVAVRSGTVNALAATPSGLVPVDTTTAALTDAGTITRTDQGGLGTVTLTSGDLSITHFAGNAFGSAIANSGSDRAIDTTTSVSIDLSNAGPDVLGSSMLRVQDISADAIRSRF